MSINSLGTLALAVACVVIAGCGSGSSSGSDGGPDDPAWVSLAIDTTGALMVLSFESGGGEETTYYYIQRRQLGEEGWAAVPGGPATVSPFYDVGPFAYGVPYEYRLQAGNDSGVSDWVVSAAVPIPTPTTPGEVLSWGANDPSSLELGREPFGETDPTPLPVDSALLDDAIAISAGYGFSLVLEGSAIGIADNELWAFGLNDLGQCGNDTAATPTLSIQPANDTAGFGTTHRVVKIAAGRFHALAVTEDISTGEQRLWGWGANDRGQIGFDPLALTSSSIPVEITDFRGTEILDIAAGGWHSMALLRISGEPRLYTWGDDAWGQLGLGNSGTSPPAGYTHAPSLVTILTGEDLAKLAAGAVHSMVVTEIVNGATGGRVLTWGMDASGQLGDGGTATAEGLNYPQDIGLSLVTEIGAGDEHSAALFLAGGVSVWGGLVVLNAPPASPQIEDAVTITCGGYFVLAVLEDGRVKGLGDNTWGQLTHDPAAGTFTANFVTAPGLAGVTLKLSGGGLHALAFED